MSFIMPAEAVLRCLGGCNDAINILIWLIVMMHRVRYVMQKYEENILLSFIAWHV